MHQPWEIFGQDMKIHLGRRTAKHKSIADQTLEEKRTKKTSGFKTTLSNVKYIPESLYLEVNQASGNDSYTSTIYMRD